jgi:hypothetical protein
LVLALIKWDAVITVAAKMQDWPLLEQAVDAKMDEQTEFVQWWDREVRGAGDPHNGGAIGAERGQLTRPEAETDTRISHQQVSRWRTSLSKPEKYRETISVAAYRGAYSTSSIRRRIFRAFGL